jgi:hypothetical protein
VRRKEHEVVWHRFDKFLKALVQNPSPLFHRVLEAGDPVEKVRTSNITNKNKVSREGSERFVGLSSVSNH